LPQPVEKFTRFDQEDAAIRDLLLRYIHCREMQLAYSVLANARYSLHECLAQ
jgi:hypothetical protein